MPASPRTSSDHQIGRFRLLRTIGRGAEGVVYLAHDPELGRDVALKTLQLGAAPDPDRIGKLLAAARTGGAFSHPNVVRVFDAGMHEGRPYVVMEYVEGRPLSKQLAADGPLSVPAAIIMMSQILAGVAQMHARGLIHGDIKPANILVGAGGIPRVSDFGLSRTECRGTLPDLAGTVRYMAPEFFAGLATDCRLDVFALGLVFHEMLTGEPVLRRDNLHAQIYRILTDPPQPPSTRNPRVPQEIDAIVLKALQKDPAARYPGAREMKLELDRIRVPAADTGPEPLRERVVHGTVEFLLRRMARKSDFPAMSATFSRINRLSARADDTSIKELSEFVMCDFALTQKLLRLVNSAAVGAGRVTRVSRAISILGVTQLRTIATAMILAGGGSAAKSPAMAAALTDAFVGGVIARNMGRLTGLPAAEELFICGMFGSLGELLAMYYLAEEHAEISRRVAKERVSRGAAARAVLGLTYDELATEVARHWQFSPLILHALQPLPDGRPDVARNPLDRSWHCAAYARELCSLSAIPDPAVRLAALDAHIDRFSRAVAVDAARVGSVMAHSVALAGKYVAAAGLPESRTPMLHGMAELSVAINDPASEEPVPPRSRSGQAAAPAAAPVEAPRGRPTPAREAPTPSAGWLARLRLAFRSLI